MKMKLSRIAEAINGRMSGDDVDVKGVGALDADIEDSVIYIESEKYLNDALSKNPAALIVPEGLNPGDIPYVIVEEVKIAFIKILKLFAPVYEDIERVFDETYIDRDAKIGKNASIMPGAVVMGRATIGENTKLYPNCVIENDVSIGRNTIIYSGVIVRDRCIIGDDCIIQPGTVIGADGYGFYQKDGEILKIPQIGNAVIGDRVEIGSNCCIDRATVGSTLIGSDTKLDNIVHIGHNVEIGEKCYIVAQVGISGSVKIGDRVTIAGQAGIADHISIADDTIIMGQSGITSNVKKPEILFGTPARPVKEHHKINASLKYLPELLKRVKRLERAIKEQGFDT